MNKKGELLIKECIENQADELDLSECGISGEEPELNVLAECTHLKKLLMKTDGNKGLPGPPNHLKCVPPLPPNVEYLDLSASSYKSGEIAEFIPFTQLHRLKKLYLQNHQLEEVNWESANALEVLEIQGNPLKVLKLKDFPSIENIAFDANKLFRLVLIKIGKLVELDLRNTKLTYLYLEELPWLKTIKIRRDSDLISFAELYGALEKIVLSLEELDSKNPQIQQFIADFKACKKEQACINNNKSLVSLPEFGKALLEIDFNLNVDFAMREVFRMIIQENIVFDKTTNPNSSDYNLSLKALPGLEDLSIPDFNINDISFLKFKELKFLDLQNNQIQNLEPLQNLGRLLKVNLSNNQISDISPLASLKELKQIDLRNNQITDIDSLKHLEKEYDMHLEGNPITEKG